MITPEKKLYDIRLEIIDLTLFSAIFLMPLSMYGTVASAAHHGWSAPYFIDIIIAFAIFITGFYRKTIPANIKMLILIFSIFCIGSSAAFKNGLPSYGLPYLLASIPITLFLFDKKWAIYCAAACAASISSIGIAYILSSRLQNISIFHAGALPIDWISPVINSLLLGIIFISLAVKYNGALTAALKNSTESTILAKQAQKVALMVMADLAEFRDSDTGDHVLRVARMSHEIARTLLQKGVPPPAAYGDDFLTYIGIASILHDVGKVGIPDAILLKPGKLTPEERLTIELHPGYGGAILQKAAKMLGNSAQFKIASEIARNHHEYWDGNGYPDKLAQDKIPLSARIVAVADVFDALTAIRPYKKAWSVEDALAFMLDRSGIQFDPAVVEALFDVLAIRQATPIVQWSDNIATGNPNIDEDHKILLQLINQIVNPENLKDKVLIEFVFDELINYTYYHFSREEDLMAKANYPDLQAHQEVHARMIVELEDLYCRFERNEENISHKLSEFLNGWLIKHIMHVDKNYGRIE